MTRKQIPDGNRHRQRPAHYGWEGPPRRGGGYNERLTYAADADALWYGCCPPLFDMCSKEDITTLFLEDNNYFLRWLGFRPAEACTIIENFIQYMAPEGSAAGTPATGIPSDFCAPGSGFEWGTCDYKLEGFGKLQDSAKVRLLGGQTIPHCVTSKRYRVDGQLIQNQDDWDMKGLLSIIMQQLAIRVLTGNKSTTNDADGLRQLVKTGYTNIDATPCTLMDSTIVNWNAQPMCSADGADGVTLNGVALADAQSFYKVLRDIHHRNRLRAQLAGMPMPAPGDVAIFMPQQAISSLIECAVCWIECSGDYTRLTSEAAAAKRAEFMTGYGGFPMITLDGFPIPIIAFDPIDYSTAAAMRGHMTNADGTVDAYMLTRAFGSNIALTLEYNDLSDQRTWPTNENGQFMVMKEIDLRCEQITMATEWRMRMPAPWAQVSFENIAFESTFTTGIKPAASLATLNTMVSTCD